MNYLKTLIVSAQLLTISHLVWAPTWQKPNLRKLVTSAETNKNTSQVAHQAGAYLCFQFLYHEVTTVEIFLRPLGGMGYPPAYNLSVPI